MGRGLRLLAATVAGALVVTVGCTTPTTPTPSTVAPTALQLDRLSTSAGRVALGQPVNLKLATPAGAVGSWVLDRNGLPPGMTFNPATGVISGTPTVVQVWYLRVHFNLTGGSGANLLPFYEVLGGVTEPMPGSPTPPEGTFHPNTSGRYIEVQNSNAYWSLGADGSLSVPDRTYLLMQGRNVSVPEFDDKSQDWFPMAGGSACSSMLLYLPSAMVGGMAYDPVTVPGVGPSNECRIRPSTDHRRFVVVESTPAPSVKVHVLGADATTVEWTTEVPGITDLPDEATFMTVDGSTVAWVVNGGQEVLVVDPSGGELLDLPVTAPDYCRLGEDDQNRSGSDPTDVPLVCSTNSPLAQHVGFIDLTDGTTALHELPDALDFAWAAHTYLDGWDIFETVTWGPGGYEGRKAWAVDFATGDADLIFEHTGTVDEDPEILFLVPA